MSKSVLMAVAALVACSAASSARGATDPASAAVTSGLSMAATNLPAAEGTSGVDMAPLINDAQQLSNAAFKVEGLAEQFAGATPMDSGSLQSSQGGTSTLNFTGAVTQQDLTATNTGNTISAASIVNGAISVGAGAFSGFNGVGNVLLNSGNQNNIQSNLSVTVVMAPAAGH